MRLRMTTRTHLPPPVTTPYGRQCWEGSGVQLSPTSWRSGGPKWSVPDGCRGESRLVQHIGPDRNRISCFRVILAKYRYWFVISFLLSPYLNYICIDHVASLMRALDPSGPNQCSTKNLTCWIITLQLLIITMSI